MHMDHKFSEIDHVTPLFEFFLVVHLQMQCPGGSFRSREAQGLFTSPPKYQDEMFLKERSEAPSSKWTFSAFWIIVLAYIRSYFLVKDEEPCCQL